ncbi:AraC family transcriptional regulator [Cryptosporangium japonicum]|uniref:AraC family transcriptional regulator n=1 Tax=Cryptosporangium japonicum TaxID=80872 RepID=UPI0031DB8B0E
MDLISEAVASTRAGRAWAVHNRYAGAWATRFPAITGAGLHVVRHGEPWLIPEDGEPVALRPGSVVFVPHGPPHGFSSAPCAFADLPAVRTPPPDPEHVDVDFVSCCYHLDRGTGHAYLNGLPDVITLVIDEERYPGVRGLADLLAGHAGPDRPGGDVALPAIVDLLLVHLLRMWRDQQDAAHPAAVDPSLAGVFDLLARPYATNLTVCDLADLARMSRASFSRRFTGTTGETPGAYLARRRLDEGARLLRHTDLPLAAVAKHLGYATEFSFSAAFRRGFGIAPGRFRNRERGLGAATGPSGR